MKLLRTSLLVLALFVLTSSPEAPAQDNPAAAPSSRISAIADELELVRVPAGQIANLRGEDRTQVSVWKYDQSKLTPIPFQIDPLSNDGHYQFEGKIPSLITARDELIWMANDMGDEAPSSALPSSWKLVPLTLRRTPTSAAKWIYVRIGEPPAPSETADYVTYQAQGDMVSSPYYQLGARDVIIFNRLAWRNADGSYGDNALNHIAVRFRARALFGLVPYEFREEDLVNRMTGMNDGPVRISQLVESSIKLPFGLRGPGNVTNAIYTRNAHTSEVTISFFPGSGLAFNQAFFNIYLDFAKRPGKWFLEFPDGARFEVSDALPADAVMRFGKGYKWIFFTSPDSPNDFLTYIDLTNDKENVFSPEELVFRGKDLVEMPRENGSFGSLSCDIRLTPKIGDHGFTLSLYTLPKRSKATTPLDFSQAIETIQKTPYRLF